MSDEPRDQEPDGHQPAGDHDDAPTADTPTTGAPAGATSGSGPAPAASRIRLTDADAGPETDPGKRRRRRLFIGGISVGAALVVIAICAGGLAVVNAVAGFRHDASEGREKRRLHETACLGLESRLNRLTPPGATATPQARAVAVQDENAATRIYVAQLRDQRSGDAWRQLLDARTAFAEGLEAQAKSRTPAFYVAPETRDQVLVTDELVRWSPAPCAGAIRRLAAPDL